MLEKCPHASVDCGASKIGITDNDPATATNRRLASTIRKPPIEHAAGPLGSTEPPR
ncbi:hypothetical protein FPK17_12480 [Mycobacterium tuberculosis]|nr:hypothetical protein [Mycobacterium tuberculosis]QOM06945.1 hypothetical protein FPK17_12480 [Mycobacterium tuberculosis]